MKKRPYRTVSVNEVDAERLAAQLGEGVVAFGVDVAKEKFKGAFVCGSAKGAPVVTVAWNSPGQVGELEALLRQVGGPARIEVAMEPSGTYGDCLRARLTCAGYRVFMVNPKRSHDAAEFYDGVPSKHDAKDAAILGMMHLEGKSRRWEVPPVARRDLAARLEVLDIFQGQEQRLVCRLEAKLARHWPELSSLLELGSATMLALLEEFGGPEGVKAAPQAALDAMSRAGGKYLAAEKAQAVVDSARRSIGEPLTAGERAGLVELAREANRNRQAVRSAEKEVERLVKDDPTLSGVAEVVGLVTAAGLQVKLGPATAYPSAAAYEKAAGLNLKERSSGTHQGRLGITKRGSSLARRLLYLAVLRLLKKQPLFRAWHAAKLERMGGKDAKLGKKSVVALMRKLVRALWHVGRGAKFDPAKLFDVARLGLATT